MDTAQYHVSRSTPGSSARRLLRRPKIIVGLLFAAATAWVFYVLVFVVPTNADNSWLIEACERLLDGERLNVDFVEVNPPFSIWLYMPFVLIERLSGIRAETALLAGIPVMAAGALWFAARVLRRVEPAYRAARYAWALPAAFLLVVGFLPLDLGQREQFALIALLPWLAVHRARCRSTDFSAGPLWERLVAGACAAVVVMVKPPYFVLPIAVPSVAEAMRRRSWRPLFTCENLLGAAITLAYLVSIVIFDRRYLTEIMPMLRELYLPMRAPFMTIVSGWPLYFVLVAAVTLRLGSGKALRRDVAALVLAALGFVPGFLIMGKGWPNHALPFMVLAFLAYGLQVLHTPRHRLWRSPVGLAGGLFVALLIVVFQHSSFIPHTDLLAARVAATKAVAAHPTVASISPRLQTAFPFVRRVDGRFISRYPSVWAIANADKLLHQAQNPRKKMKLREIRDRSIARLARELAEKRPQIVVSMPEDAPFVQDVLLKNPAMRAVLRGYRLLTRDAQAEVLVRSTAGSGLRGQIKQVPEPGGTL